MENDAQPSAAPQTVPTKKWLPNANLGKVALYLSLVSWLLHAIGFFYLKSIVHSTAPTDQAITLQKFMDDLSVQTQPVGAIHAFASLIALLGVAFAIGAIQRKQWSRMVLLALILNSVALFVTSNIW